MRVDILSVPVDVVTFDQAVDQIVAFTKDGNSHSIVTANPEMVVEAQKNLAFREALQRADFVVPDGVGLLPVAHFLSESQVRNRGKVGLIICLAILLLRTLLSRNNFSPLHETVSGVDLVQALCKRAQDEQLSIIFLGGNPGEAENAKKAMVRQYPNANIVADPGARRVDKETEAEWQQIRTLISTQTAPVLLFVAYGHPKQELWITRHLSELPNTTAMGVGGTFAYIGQTKTRAPKVFRQMGLEWLWRLIAEPSRLKRIFTASVYFPYLAYRFAVSRS